MGNSFRQSSCISTNTIHNPKCTEHNAQYTMHNTQYTMHNTQYTMHMQCTLHKALLTAQCTMHYYNRSCMFFVCRKLHDCNVLYEAERKWRGLLRVHLLTTEVTVQNHMRATSFDDHHDDGDGGDHDCDHDDG